jgi:hypothetical protein
VTSFTGAISISGARALSSVGPVPMAHLTGRQSLSQGTSFAPNHSVEPQADPFGRSSMAATKVEHGSGRVETANPDRSRKRDPPTCGDRPKHID